MFDTYTQVHWHRIFFLERRLVEALDPAERSAYSTEEWAAMQQLLADGVIEQTSQSEIVPEFGLTDLGWELAGRVRRFLAGNNVLTDFVYLAPAELDKVHFWGCIVDKGHMLWSRGHRIDSRFSRTLPWRNFDQALTPQHDKRQGVDELHHLNGWTAWAQHDYSVDTRPGSNAIFFAPGIRSRAAMRLIAAEAFPTIFERLELAKSGSRS